MIKLPEGNKFWIELNKEIEMLEKDGLDPEELQQRINSIYVKICDLNSKDRLKNILKKYSQILNENKLQHQKFLSLLDIRWKKPIDLLECFWLFSVQSGQKSLTEYRSNSENQEDIIFLTLNQLHGRACLVASEIITLLKNGYPDAAMARWRTLYEILITADFIKKNNEETAIKFLEYEQIESYLALENYQKFAEKLKQTPFTEEEIEKFEKNIEPLKKKYGTLFRNRYGWTAQDSNVTTKEKPTFAKIALKSDYARYYPYYTFASYMIHSSSKSIKESLGQPRNQKRVILAGPSDASGIADPGMMTAITLLQVNIQFLSLSINPNQVITLMTMMLLERIIVQEFGLALDNQTN